MLIFRDYKRFDFVGLKHNRRTSSSPSSVAEGTEEQQKDESDCAKNAADNSTNRSGTFGGAWRVDTT